MIPWFKILGGTAALLAVLLIIQTVRFGNERDARIEAEADVAAEIKKHQATKEGYRAAQAEAAALEEARLRRVVSKQEEISNERVETYEQRIADLRARWLRTQGNSASGARGTESVSSLSDTSCRVDGEAEDYELLLIASEQAVQLDELITWIHQQTGVDPN